jgi:hypothetical protein
VRTVSDQNVQIARRTFEALRARDIGKVLRHRAYRSREEALDAVGLAA